jgi:hypothetical protein
MTKPLVRLMAVLVTMVAARSWALTFDTVHTFPANGTEGTKPVATLTIGPDRSLYGTTTEGGPTAREPHSDLRRRSPFRPWGASR